MTRIRLAMVTSAAVVVLAPAVLAQGVAFQPVVGSLPSGPILNTTPAVSIDRRYVRLGINAQFIDNAAFNTIVVPGAVSGGPSGPGALGGVGLGGAGGGAGVGGGQFLAGMDGVIDPSAGYGPAGIPQGAAFPGYYSLPYEMAPMWGAGMPQGSDLQRRVPPRVVATNVVKRGRKLPDKKKQPAAAASAAPVRGRTQGAGP